MFATCRFNFTVGTHILSDHLYYVLQRNREPMACHFNLDYITCIFTHMSSELSSNWTMIILTSLTDVLVTQLQSLNNHNFLSRERILYKILLHILAIMLPWYMNNSVDLKSTCQYSNIFQRLTDYSSKLR